MNFLLDTVTLSELRKRHRDANVNAWIGRTEAGAFYLSVISVGDIERGIVRAPTKARAAQLGLWLDTLLRDFADRIVPFGEAEARAWGRMSARLTHNGPDIQIAATALVHGLTVATRNVRHFNPTGVRVFNPWEASSPVPADDS